jgi:hypothetical protein
VPETKSECSVFAIEWKSYVSDRKFRRQACDTVMRPSACGCEYAVALNADTVFIQNGDGSDRICALAEFVAGGSVLIRRAD